MCDELQAIFVGNVFKNIHVAVLIKVRGFMESVLGIYYLLFCSV
jgi:hypothetical protein